MPEVRVGAGEVVTGSTARPVGLQPGQRDRAVAVQDEEAAVVVQHRPVERVPAPVGEPVVDRLVPRGVPVARVVQRKQVSGVVCKLPQRDQAEPVGLGGAEALIELARVCGPGIEAPDLGRRRCSNPRRSRNPALSVSPARQLAQVRGTPSADRCPVQRPEEPAADAAAPPVGGTPKVANPVGSAVMYSIPAAAYPPRVPRHGHPPARPRLPAALSFARASRVPPR